ncbi:MAG: serine hydrolase [Spirochaetales bacterium]|nr:serine hydrolase [Spirochaetales bacterium]
MKNRKLKITISVISIVILAVSVTLAGNAKKISRLNRAMTLFAPEKIDENFRTMDKLFDATIVATGDQIFSLNYGKKPLPDKYTFQGEEKSTQQFIEETQTTSLIVLQDKTILFEEYYRGNDETSKSIVWSVSKSFTSALFGIAIQEGYIKSIEDNVTDYLPELRASGYNKVRIKDVLQMSSGVEFNEDYADFHSDINRLGRYFALNKPLLNFINTLQQERTPGTFNHYTSMDTQVLGMIVVAATGKSLSQYTEEKLWKPLGMEANAAWLIDNSGMETAFGGFNATSRDLARFGRLYLKLGEWEGSQIINKDWVKDSTTPDAPHLQPGPNPNSDYVLGYGYQWWIPENPDGEFLAIGVYGQAIYIYPKYNIVIVKTSAYADYTDNEELMELEAIEFFRNIARKI